MNPSVMMVKHYGQVDVLDLDMSLQRVMSRTECNSDPTARRAAPTPTAASILFTSFQGRHILQGWMLKELLRLLTHSSTRVLCANTYAPESTQRVSSGQFFKRSRRHGGLSYLLRESETPKDSEVKRIFQDLQACVLTLSNAQEWPVLI